MAHTLRKRLAVKNDGFCNCKKSAKYRIDVVINRYLAKMSKKGWYPTSSPAAGNCFAFYEAIIYMQKPDSQSVVGARKLALEQGFLEKDGVFYWN